MYRKFFRLIIVFLGYKYICVIIIIKNVQMELQQS